MPTLEDINKIKSQILEIAHEPSILAERGESPVDVQPPQSGLSDDLNELLGDSFDDLSAEDELLDGLFDSEEESAENGDGAAEEAPGEPEEPGAEEESFDLPDLEEDFSLSEEDGGDELLDGLFDSEEESAESGDGAAEEAPGEPEEPGAEEESFDLPDIEEESLDLPGVEEDFELPDLEDDLDLPDSDLGETGEIDLSADTDTSDIPGEKGGSGTDPFPDEQELDGVDFSEADDLDLEDFEVADSETDEDDFEVDEFNLGDLGQDFGVLEESDDLDFTPPESSPFDESEASVPVEESEESEEDFQLTEEEFAKLTATLKTLPRNLKLVIEEYIGEKNLSGEKLKKLTDALIAGKSPKEIAAVTSKVTGQRIKIPSGYEKKSGINFEEEKDSFSYRFRHIFLPLLKKIALSTIVISALTFLGYRYVYNPLYSLFLYNKGYKELEAGNYINANEYFDKAADIEVFKKQFYRYAEGFAGQKQWTYAEAKYDELLKFYPLDKKGTIDYASMEFYKLYNYEKASKLLKNFLSDPENATDYDALLLYGDVNLEWGSEDPSRYETARRAYARIMKNYGTGNEVLFRMMKYFIRTDNYKEVEILKRRFQADKELVVDPEVYAELAEYQINRNDLDDVRDILFRAKDVDPTLPEIHYQLARYFRKVKDPVEEDKALAQALHYLKEKEPLSMKRREMMIDVYRRTGERSYAKKEYLQSQEYYEKGIALLNESRKLSVVRFQNPDYGKLYADLGDIYYFVAGDLERALDMYNKAEEEEYHSTDIDYKKGYIYYTEGKYKNALLDFYNAAGTFSTNTNLIYATANTLYFNNDLFMAQGYYNHLLDILENRLYAEQPLQLAYREDHRKLVNDLVRATNNMGVVMYGLYERTGDPKDFTQALVYFTRSDDYFDTLTRDPETMNRSKSVNLAFLNQKKLLYPVKGYTLQIYRDIEKDMHRMNFD